MQIRISGKSYHAACDRRVSSVPKEEGWPEPSAKKIGYGWQYIYEGDALLAEQIASHMKDVGEGFVRMDGADKATVAEGRVLIKDAEKIYAHLSALKKGS